MHPVVADMPSAVVRRLGRNFTIDRKLGKHGQTAQDGLVLQLGGQVLGAAVDAGMIAQNPCRRVPLPRIERREMRFLTPAEVVRLADSIRPGYRALVLLGA